MSDNPIDSATDDGLEVVAALEKALEAYESATNGEQEARGRRAVMNAAGPDELRTILTLLAASRAEVERLQAALGEIAWSNDSKWQSDRADKALNGAALSNKTTKD